MQTEPMTPGTTAQDMNLSRAWTGRFIVDAAQIPISFLYDGHRIAGIPADWTPSRHERRVDANILEIVYRGRDPRTGLQVRVEALRYLDYPVVEWTAWLTNGGDAPTPILSALQGLDGSFAGTSPVLSHCNGDFYSEEGYTPRESPVRDGETLTFAPTGGRPCDGAFPYFRLAFADCGLTLAVGWPAQWSAAFTGYADGVSITAGQQQTHLRLLPGESIRTPRITLLSWTGDQTTGRKSLAPLVPGPCAAAPRWQAAAAAAGSGGHRRRGRVYGGHGGESDQVYGCLQTARHRL